MTFFYTAIHLEPPAFSHDMARPVSTSRIAFVKDVEPAAVPAVDIYDLKGLANNFKFLYDMYTYQSPIEFQGDVVTSRLQKTVHKLGAIE